MKILQLCKKFPFPLKDGEAIAITFLAEALDEQGAEISLLAMNTSKHHFDLRLLPETFEHYSAIHTVDLDNRISPLAAFGNLFSKKSFHISRFISPIFEAKLVEVLTNTHFDVVQLETLYLAPYIDTIRKHSNALVVMRAHNVEHEIWQRITDNASFLPKKWYLQHLTKKLQRFENQVLNAYDLLLAISERDRQYFEKSGLKKPSVTVPIGLDCAQYRPDFSSFDKAVSLSFIGSLDWMPNLEGLKWFLNEVWKPILSVEHPEITFHIAGRNTPRWLRQLGWKNVIVHGEVSSAADFINQHSVMVVPLLSGSGMRAKILEGMALGKAVVSTRIGLEGIGAEHKNEVLVADSPQEMAAAINFCLKKGQKLAQIGRRARTFAEENFDNQAIARQLLDVYLSMRPPISGRVFLKNNR
jgi:polysaccharide biosynthesis protein PslH